MTKRRFKDRRRVGHSYVVPLKQGESHSERHSRRLEANLESERKVREWCEENGVALTVTNNGHHWKFFKVNICAEWWPSSAKLVLFQRYRKGIHVHDWTQLLFVLNQEWVGRVHKGRPESAGRILKRARKVYPKETPSEKETERR